MLFHDLWGVLFIQELATKYSQRSLRVSIYSEHGRVYASYARLCSKKAAVATKRNDEGLVLSVLWSKVLLLHNVQIIHLILNNFHEHVACIKMGCIGVNPLRN